MCGWRSGEVDVGEVGRGDTVDLTTSIEIPQMAAVHFGCGGGLGAHWRHSTRKERRGGAPSSFVACLYSRCGSGTAEGGALTYRVVPVSEGRDSTIDKR